MISLQELKNKIQETEEQIKNKGFSVDEVGININHMTEIKTLNVDFICDEYYGVFVRINISD